MSLFNRSSLKWWVAVLLGIGAFVFLASRVSEKAHPWERVALIENGLAKGEYNAATMNRRSVCCLSPDEKSLFVATAGGMIEQWDLESFQKTRSFGVGLRKDEQKKENLHLAGAWNLEITDSGELLESRWSRMIRYSLTGELLESRDIDAMARYSVSPDGEWIARGRVNDLSITNLKSGEKVATDVAGWNGGNSRLQWSKDSRFLLFSEALGFALIDAQEKQVKWVKLNRNQELLGEGKGTIRTKEEASKGNVAKLIDSQLVDKDSKIASIYDARGWSMRMSPVDELENVLIFTHINTGEILERVDLPHPPRSMWVSEDGQMIYVTMCPDMKTVMVAINAESMKPCGLVKSKFTNKFPTSAVGLGDGQNVIQYSNGAWQQDLKGSYLPIRIESLGADVLQVLTTKQADLIVVVLNNREVHVWKKRREPSRWGALVLWEYWSSFLILTLGLLISVLYLARKSQMPYGRLFSGTERLLLVVSTLVLSISIFSFIYDQVFGDIWLYTEVPFRLARLIGILVAGCCLYGYALQKGWWRRLFRFISLIGIGYAIYMIVMGSSMFLSIDSKAYSAVTIPLDRADGVLYYRSLGEFMLQPVGLLFYRFFVWWVLRTRFVDEF